LQTVALGLLATPPAYDRAKFILDQRALQQNSAILSRHGQFFSQYSLERERLNLYVESLTEPTRAGTHESVFSLFFWIVLLYNNGGRLEMEMGLIDFGQFNRGGHVAEPSFAFPVNQPKQLLVKHL
jgi:hypothetical protein